MPQIFQESSVEYPTMNSVDRLARVTLTSTLIFKIFSQLHSGFNSGKLLTYVT